MFVSKGDKEALELWSEFRELSIEKYRDTFSRLGVEFDEYTGESQVPREAQVAAFNELLKSDFVAEDKGALVADLKKYKLEKTIIRKRDGTTTYISRDIGGAAERYKKYNFDKMIYVVAVRTSEKAFLPRATLMSSFLFRLNKTCTLRNCLKCFT